MFQSKYKTCDKCGSIAKMQKKGLSSIFSVYGLPNIKCNVYVCTECGEIIYTAKELKRIFKKIRRTNFILKRVIADTKTIIPADEDKTP